jgi:Protein of unknown function (DUF4242)
MNRRGPLTEAEVTPIGDCQERDMAKFMDVHRGFVGVTEHQLREAHERDLAVESAEGVHVEHAWLDPESGTAFCLSSGPSKEAVRRVHEKAGHPTEEIYELSVDVEQPPCLAPPRPHQRRPERANFEGATPQ